MEFATDVLGDDIVQRTAGEALRNTVGHAVRPASTVIFTTFGLGLLLSGVLAVGYARSTEHEVYLFEAAVKSFASNAAFGMKRMATWPGRAFRGMGERVWYCLMFPARFLWSRGERALTETSVTLHNQWNFLSLLPNQAVDSALRALRHAVQSTISWGSSTLFGFAGYLRRSLNLSLQSMRTGTVSVAVSTWRHVIDCMSRFGHACVVFLTRGSAV
jgi:hypothetical protein